MTTTRRALSGLGASALLIGTLLVLAGALLSPATKAVAGKDFSLARVHEQVVSRYRGVRHLAPGKLKTMLEQEPDKLLILDVREEAEYAVSHLPGAKRVDPGIWRASFMRRFAREARGRTVVFYCSVGVRSSRLAAYVGEALGKAGARGVYNLAGGIFAWHNRRYPLVNAKGPTAFVHPYDAKWGRLVERQALTRYAPR